MMGRRVAGLPILQQLPQIRLGTPIESMRTSYPPQY